jgi:outer membrane protein insertion porin family
MNISSLLIVLCVALLPAARPAAAQPAAPQDVLQAGDSLDGRAIARVEFLGLHQVSEAWCRSQVTSVAGQAFSMLVAQEDRRRLNRSGKFLDVQMAATLEDERVVLTFRLAERPIITAIEFTGNEKFSTDELLKELHLAVGDPLNRAQLELAADRIEQRYKNEGYAQATVTLDAEALQSQGRVHLQITEGLRTRVREIRFEGGGAFPERELKAIIETETWFPILRTGDFNPDRAERDAAEIQNFYRDRGYLDARVTTRTEPRPTPGDLIVIFVITEGEVYSIASIHFEGNVVLTSEELLSRIKLKPGAVMRLDQLRLDTRTVEDAFGALGYLYVSVQPPLPVFTEVPGQVQITFRIQEGKPYRVGRIVPRGNMSTQDKVIRRELEFYPGELFNVPKMRLSEDKLRRTELFKNEFVHITAVGEQERVRDVLVDVVENDRTINFLVGGGVGSNSGLAGTISLESRNFDITDVPQTWEEMLRFQAFRGAGQYFRIELAPGTEVSSFRVVFRDSYFLDKPLTFGTNLYLFERERDEYNEQRLGTVLSLGKTLETGWLKGWASELAFRLEQVRIDDLETLFGDGTIPAKDIREAKGTSVLTTLKPRLVRNRTDSRLLPSRGDVLSFGLEQAVGSYTFSKLEGDYTWYHTLHTDQRERKGIVAFRTETGVILGDAPVFERYYAGGIGTLRGFDFRGVTPRDGPFWDDDQAIGGDFLLLASAEYSFPLWSSSPKPGGGETALRGVLFTDMGTVEEDIEISTWRASVGFGLRLLIEQLGPVPFEFNFAWPVAKDRQDDTEVFSFAVGLSWR